MKKNNKGFTLIELLAVIVVLAIIMVIATQQINKTISRTRAKSMISSLELAARGVKTKMADGSMAVCSGACLKDVIDYNEDEEYNIVVTQSDSDWVITLTAVSGGEFASADFNEVSEYDDESGKVGKITVNQAERDGDKLPSISCTVDGESGSMK